MKLWGDLETYSETPIRDGVWRYSESAEIMLWPYAIDDGDVRVWDVVNDELWTESVQAGVGWVWRTERARVMPRDLFNALTDDACELCFHNAGFDRTILLHAGSVVEHAAAKALHRWHCTMAQALAHSLPGGLGKLGEILGTPADTQKDKEGHRLVQLFCKPRPAGQKLRRATKATHPEEWAKFVQYAAQDIVAMRANHAKMPMWNYRGFEKQLWQLDAKINERGLGIDLELVDAAIRASERAKAGLAAEAVELTGGALTATTQRAALLAHLLAEHGVSLPDMQASTIERRLDDPDLPPAVKELLQNRLQASSTSVAKYKVLKRSVSSDGRLRGTKQFCGAIRTGRWSGKIFQPDNLPSRGLLPQELIDLGIESMKADCEHLVFDDVMHLCSSAIRGVITPEPGKKMVCADLSNIEGRFQAWLADETWKLDAFRSFDAGTGPDLYKLAYSKSFGVKPEDVTKDQRQVGKVQELAFGYAGGVGACITFAIAYGIDLEAMGELMHPSLPDDLRYEAEGFLDWTKRQRRPTFGLSDRTFVTCESFKRGWRRSHAAIAGYWGALESTQREAIGAPGVTLTCGRLKIRRDGNWLRIQLPSGRALCYPSPQVVPFSTECDECKGSGYITSSSSELGGRYAPMFCVKCSGTGWLGKAKNAGQISYMGVNQYSRKLERIDTHGGKTFEQCCQGGARDALAWALPGIEDAGYGIVLTVHDEPVTEAPDTDEYTGERLAALLAVPPPWALDLPLAAEGFEAMRYRK